MRQDIGSSQLDVIVDVIAGSAERGQRQPLANSPTSPAAPATDQENQS
jgi:hypothetical protein